MERLTATLLLGSISILAAFGLSACKSGGELRFAWNNAPPLAALHPTPGRSELFSSSELGAVPSTCTTGLQVQYDARNYHRSTATEAVLFALAPSTIEARLSGLSDASKLGGSWQLRATIPGTLPSTLSQVVALGPEPSAPQPATSIALPDTIAFWGPDPANLELIARRNCNPAGGGPPIVDSSVQAVAVYYHGACGAIKDLTSILNQVVESVWNGFRTTEHLDGPQSHYRHATSILEEGSFTDGKQTFLTPGSNVRGGFLFTFHFRADILSGNNEVWGTYKYLFSLNDGVLAITDDDVSQLELDSSGTWGWKIEDGLRNGVEHEVPNTLSATALTEQQVQLPAPLTCTNLVECENASAFFAAAITPEKIKAAGFPEPTAAELQSLQCAVGSRFHCDALGRTVDMQRLWACPLFQLSLPGVPPVPCKFRLRAKRLLVFPNELELVWFDDAEYGNPVFALFVLATSQDRANLCSSRTRPPGANGLGVRNFANVGSVGGS